MIRISILVGTRAVENITHIELWIIELISMFTRFTFWTLLLHTSSTWIIAYFNSFIPFSSDNSTKGDSVMLSCCYNYVNSNPSIICNQIRIWQWIYVCLVWYFKLDYHSNKEFVFWIFLELQTIKSMFRSRQHTYSINWIIVQQLRLFWRKCLYMYFDLP